MRGAPSPPSGGEGARPAVEPDRKPLFVGHRVDRHLRSLPLESHSKPEEKCSPSAEDFLNEEESARRVEDIAADLPPSSESASAMETGRSGDPG